MIKYRESLVANNAFAEDVQASLAAGMDAHLSKPFVIQNVLETISRLLVEA